MNTPFRPPSPRRAGMSILEVLIAMAVAGVLMGLVVTSMRPLQRTLALEEAGTHFAQDLQWTRARAMVTGNRWRLRATGTGGYAVEEETGGAWKGRRSRAFKPNTSFVNLASGDTFTFTSRGFGAFAIAGTPTSEVRISDGNATLRLVPSLVGAVRTVKL